MNSLENYYKQIIKYDLINKFFYSRVKDIPKLKKIILNFGCKHFETKNVAASFLSLELITGKQSTLIKSKRVNILLKIRKGYPVGCTVVLRQKKMYCFFFKVLIDVFPNLKFFKGISLSKNLKSKNFSLTLKDLIYFKELEKQFYLFTKLPPLNIILVTNIKSRKELTYLLNSFKIPIV